MSKSQEPKFKVVIGEPVGQSGIDFLKYNPHFEVVALQRGEDKKLKKELADADVLIVRSGIPVDADLLDIGQNLKIVGRAGAGIDHIDVDACSERGIVVMRVLGGNSNGVVELTIGTMISLIRNIPKADKLMKEGVWAKGKLKGTELKGKTIGLIGLGRIGGKVAVICEAIGMQVMALVRNKNKKRKYPFHGKFVDNLDELLPHVDFLSLHLPLNEHTKGMIGKEEIEKMKPSAYIINTARGAIIDEDALYEALKEGKIKGASVDVYSEEPSHKDNFPFIEMDNVVATPHLGATTVESQENVSQIMCENIAQALLDNVYLDAVNLPFKIPADAADKYGPFLLLAKHLGEFTGQWKDKKIEKIELTYRFRKEMDIKPITSMTVAEMLKYTNPEISLINVEKKIEQKGIDLKVRDSTNLNFDNSLRTVITYNDGERFDMRGVCSKSIPKVVEIQEMGIEMIPRGNVLVIINKNVPGVVGVVGSKLGENEINISSYNLAESKPGQDVIGCIMVDQEVPDKVIEGLKKEENIVDAKKIKF